MSESALESESRSNELRLPRRLLRPEYDGCRPHVSGPVDGVCGTETVRIWKNAVRAIRLSDSHGDCVGMTSPAGGSSARRTQRARAAEKGCFHA
jgi:hypothetical protein